MADLLASLIRPDRGPSLPSLDRFAPPPPMNLVVAEIEARSSPGDVVIDLHGRGGWIAPAPPRPARRPPPPRPPCPRARHPRGGAAGGGGRPAPGAERAVLLALRDVRAHGGRRRVHLGRRGAGPLPQDLPLPGMS